MKTHWKKILIIYVLLAWAYGYCVNKTVAGNGGTAFSWLSVLKTPFALILRIFGAS